MEERITALEASQTTQDNSISALDTSITNMATTVSNMDTTVGEIQTKITTAESDITNLKTTGNQPYLTQYSRSIEYNILSFVQSRYAIIFDTF